MVAGAKQEQGYRVQGCGCKSWFCRTCAFGRGMRLREILQKSMRWWRCKTPLMISLTINPELFDSPQAALDYVRKGRLVSRLLRELRRRGLVLSHRYFGVVEWQANGWPHWHILIDADFVEFGVIQEIWFRYGPKDRPHTHNPMGWVWVNKDKRDGQGGRSFANKKHALEYLTKYLTKYPRQGYPQWVLESCGHIKRYTTSHGLIKEAEGAEGPAVEEGPPGKPKKRGAYGRTAPTIAGRVAVCGSQAVLIYRRCDGSGRFVTRIPFACVDLAELLKRELGATGFYCSPSDALRLEDMAAKCRRGGAEVEAVDKGEWLQDLERIRAESQRLSLLGERGAVGVGGYYGEGM